jgi:5'-3' exonuclease
MAWTLKYYVTGCQSWGWYYPFHYAPFLSDMNGLSQHCVYELGFTLGQPYTPLQQLLAVLPPGSAWALPGAYRQLMLQESSPIRDFYPAQFSQDVCSPFADFAPFICTS